jgi:hypothetical protein
MSVRAGAALRQKVTMSTNPFTINPFVPSFTSSNPFAGVEQEKTPVGETSYVMVQSAPKVASDEVESAHMEAIEVMVMWGDTVLHIEHLSPPRSFSVGESGADFVLAADVLGGATNLPVVNVDAAGTVRVATANGQVELQSGQKVGFALPGTAIRFEVSQVRAGKKIEAGFLAGLSLSAHKFTGLSFVAHAALFAAFAFFMPKMSADDAENANRDNILYMQKMLNASADREMAQQENMDGASDSAATGGTGERHKGEEGEMGKTTPTASKGRYGIEGPRENPNPELQRRQDLQAARDFGMIGIVSSMSMDTNAPASPWGADAALGRDEKSALGNMWGASIDEALGGGGLGLSGVGEGGGGNGAGIGLDTTGGLGHGAGCLSGNCGQGIGPGGMGMGHGRLPGTHKSTFKGPRDAGPPQIGGHLPPEVIQRVVRQNFGKFRVCYEAGLRNNPSLTGRVNTKFVIGRDGSVNVSQDAGSDLPDQAVVSCVVRAYQQLSFPQPDNGIVTVSYPIMFSPGE